MKFVLYCGFAGFIRRHLAQRRAWEFLNLLIDGGETSSRLIGLAKVIEDGSSYGVPRTLLLASGLLRL